MKLKVKLLPLIMTLLSALYLTYVISSEDTTLNADIVGGDPGGKLLPMVIAIFLFAGFLFITIKERPSGEKMDKDTVVLFIITLLASVLYVALTKVVGFIILSTVLLYSLEYLYSTIGEKRKPLEAILGGVGTLALTTICYLLIRLISKLLIRAAKRNLVPSVFGNGTLIAVICLVVVVGITVLLAFTLVRFLKKKGLNRVASAFIITFCSVLSLYVIFRQFFLVQLAPGLINF